MRIIIGADGFQLRSSLADGREPLGRHIRGHVRRRKQGAAAVDHPIGATPARRRAGACCQPLGVTSHFLEARAGPREPKPSCWRTGGQILPAESPIGRRGAGRGTPQPWRATMGGVFGFLSGSTNAASRVTPFRPGALTLDVNTGCQKNREQRQECGHRGIALCLAQHLRFNR
jgi:hypothetical protein